MKNKKKLQIKSVDMTFKEWLFGRRKSSWMTRTFSVRKQISLTQNSEENKFNEGKSMTLRDLIFPLIFPFSSKGDDDKWSPCVFSRSYFPLHSWNSQFHLLLFVSFCLLPQEHEWDHCTFGLLLRFLLCKRFYVV